MWYAFSGVLVDLHHPVDGWNETAIAGIPTDPCGPLNLHAFEELAAVRWALEIINNKTWPEEFDLGEFSSQHDRLHVKMK